MMGEPTWSAIEKSLDVLYQSLKLIISAAAYVPAVVNEREFNVEFAASHCSGKPENLLAYGTLVYISYWHLGSEISNYYARYRQNSLGPAS